MRITFNEDDMKTSNFLGEGQHEVAITKVTDGKSKAGKDMVTVEFTARNGRSCLDWFTMDFKKKFYGLALACGVPSNVLVSDGVESQSLQGKRLTLIRTVTGKRVYTDNQGVAKETDNFENSFVSLSSGGSFTDQSIPF